MNNLIIPQNEGIGKGILAQVPWHKHGEYGTLMSSSFRGCPCRRTVCTQPVSSNRLGGYEKRVHVLPTRRSRSCASNSHCTGSLLLVRPCWLLRKGIISEWRTTLPHTLFWYAPVGSTPCAKAPIWWNGPIPKTIVLISWETPKTTLVSQPGRNGARCTNVVGIPWHTCGRNSTENILMPIFLASLFDSKVGMVIIDLTVVCFSRINTSRFTGVFFPDILFHTPEVLEKIRECVDARWQKPYFVFSPAPAKQNKYFSKFCLPYLPTRCADSLLMIFFCAFFAQLISSPRAVCFPPLSR